ncbi:MAG TPA: hypothetical protein VH370_12095, partial [Humisphaera sp.]|nr:hypothetical protein [Humisphaera sp.]
GVLPDLCVAFAERAQVSEYRDLWHPAGLSNWSVKLVLHLPRDGGKLLQAVVFVGCATKNHIANELTAAKNPT